MDCAGLQKAKLLRSYLGEKSNLGTFDYEDIWARQTGS